LFGLVTHAGDRGEVTSLELADRNGTLCLWNVHQEVSDACDGFSRGIERILGDQQRPRQLWLRAWQGYPRGLQPLVAIQAAPRNAQPTDQGTGKLLHTVALWLEDRPATPVDPAATSSPATLTPLPPPEEVRIMCLTERGACELSQPEHWKALFDRCIRGADKIDWIEIRNHSFALLRWSWDTHDAMINQRVWFTNEASYLLSKHVLRDGQSHQFWLWGGRGPSEERSMAELRAHYPAVPPLARRRDEFVLRACEVMRSHGLSDHSGSDPDSCRVLAARALYDKASEILGYDLAKLCFEGPAEELDSTVCSQPALFVTSLVAIELLRQSSPDVLVYSCSGRTSPNTMPTVCSRRTAKRSVRSMTTSRGRLPSLSRQSLVACASPRLRSSMYEW
jgi:hypothetical protein